MTRLRADVAMASGPLLSLRSVSLWQSGENTRRIVERVSLEIPIHGCLALLGESGAGKTSLALAIMGLWPGRMTGEIIFDGQELTTLAPAAYRNLRGRRLALMLQDPKTALNPVLTIGRQLREVLKVRRGLGRADVRQEALVWLERVGLTPATDIARAYPHEMSGGMAQRAALAVALACRPELLIADEPFSALDSFTAAEQVELLRQCRAESAFSLLLITHDLNLAKTMADGVAVLKDGRLVESGPADEVMVSPHDEYTRELLRAARPVGSLAGAGDGPAGASG